MNVEQLVAEYPTVFHTASERAWPSIRRYGLLSTQRLLLLYDVSPDEQMAVLTQRRLHSVALEARGMAPALARDQKPMKFLAEKMAPGERVEDFLMAINSRVFFFWPSVERLERLRPRSTGMNRR